MSMLAEKLTEFLTGFITPKSDDEKPQVLVFTRMAAYVHESTPAAASFVATMARKRGYHPVVSSDPKMIERKGGKQWAVIVLVNNSGDCFDLVDEALTEHVLAGRGVLGVHAAVASFLDGEDAVGGTIMKPKTELIADILGAHFVNHPPPQTGTLKIDLEAIGSAFDFGFFKECKAIKRLPTEMELHDEWFNYDRQPGSLPGCTVLARVDEATYEGGSMGVDHPMVWCAQRGPAKAPVFYCGIGHFDSLYDGKSVVSKFLEAGFTFVTQNQQP